jgi:hypothetical protein
MPQPNPNSRCSCNRPPNSSDEMAWLMGKAEAATRPSRAAHDSFTLDTYATSATAAAEAGELARYEAAEAEARCVRVCVNGKRSTQCGPWLRELGVYWG